MTARFKALIVDDHALLAQGVAIALEAEGVETRVSAALTFEDVIREATDMLPDVVLLDLQLEGEIGYSTPLIEPLNGLGAKVVMVTGVKERPDLAACIEAGAVGLASKSDPFEELVVQVLRAARGERLLPQSEEYELLDELRQHRAAERERLQPFDRLTPREEFVLARIMEGLQAEAIAAASYVSVATVRSQIRSILQKLEVNSQLAAAALARRSGWAPDDAHAIV